MARKETKRKYGSAAGRAKAAAAVAGPGGGGGTMFQNIPQGTQFYNPEEGKATLRLLPYIVSDPKHPDGDSAPVGDIWYKRPFKRFRQIGLDKKPYISPKSINKPCPIMEYYSAAKADPSIPDKEADRAKPQDMVMYNVQVLDQKTKSWSDPMFWFFSYACFEKPFKKELMDPDNEDYLAFMDLEGGYDIRVRWEKESFGGHDFLSAGNISFIERDDLDESILDEVIDLDTVLKVLPYKDLQNLFLEIDEEGEDSEQEPEQEEKPARSARGKKSAEPEPEEQPRRGRKRDPEPEPESEEKPARRSRATKEPEPEPERPARRSRKPEPVDECPHGFVFGDDFDTKKKCDKCEVFESCETTYNASITPAEKKSDKEVKPAAGKKGKASDEENECPSGYRFGTDCDEKPECKDCPVWDACMDRQEELEAK